jgi:hypothetical protein
MKISIPASITVIGTVFCFLFALTASSALAQVGAGIGLAPAIIEEGADPGEVQRYTVNVTNLSELEQTYYVYMRDIVGVSGDNSPIYGDENAEPSGFELSKWVTLDVDQITVPPQQSVPVSFTVSVPKEAAPGSHFGALFVSQEPPRLRSTGAGVGYDVANIISIRIAGDADERAEIRQFSTRRYLHGSTNVDFSLHIQNLGNVLIRPVGPVEITNMFGKQVALFTFNESGGSVFPGAVRTYEFNWQDDGLGFGRYEARVSPVYGQTGSRSTISSTVVFWILPMNIIAPAAGILATLLLVVYVGVRIYVRRTVALMASGGERRVIRTVRRRGSSVFLMTFLAMAVTTALFLIVLLLLFA